MKTYRVACFWTMMGEMEIEANSLKEAMEKALDDEPLPIDPEYVDCSFEIDHESTQELNKEIG